MKKMCLQKLAQIGAVSVRAGVSGGQAPGEFFLPGNRTNDGIFGLIIGFSDGVVVPVWKNPGEQPGEDITTFVERERALNKEFHAFKAWILEVVAEAE